MQHNGSGPDPSGHVFLRTAKASGARSWYAKYRVFDPAAGEMRQVQKRLGPAHAGKGRPAAGAFTEKTAEAELRRILTKAEENRLDAKYQPSTGKTFGEAAENWLAWLKVKKGRKPSTLSDYRSVLNVHLNPTIGADTPLIKITRSAVDRLEAQLLAGRRPGGPVPAIEEVVPEWKESARRRTAQKVLSLLHAILKRAKSIGWVPRDPMEDFEIPKPTRKGFNTLTGEQIEQVARATETTMAGALIRVAAYSGLRWGELRALRWDDVVLAEDPRKSIIVVRRSFDDRAEHEGSPKSGSDRTVPINAQARAAFLTLRERGVLTEPSDLVFPGEDGGFVADAYGRTRLNLALEAAGLGHLRQRAPGRHPFRFHDLRHTFGTNVGMSGAVPLATLQAWMGHAKIETTMRYVHHAAKPDDTDRLTLAFGGIVEPQLRAA